MKQVCLGRLLDAYVFVGFTSMGVHGFLVYGILEVWGYGNTQHWSFGFLEKVSF